MTDASAALTLTRTYDPYGNVVSSSGTGETAYGYTGEMQAGGLVHLRARDYASQLGRFTSRDTWEGGNKNPAGYNKWIYVSNNPIIFTDHKGFFIDCEDLMHNDKCDQISSIDIENFNEKVKPSQIEFNPGFDPLQNGANGLEKGKNNAQELYYNNMMQSNLCGLVVLTAIINSKNPGIGILHVLDDYSKNIEGLANQQIGIGRIKQFVNLVYQEELSIDPKINFISNLPFENNDEGLINYYDTQKGKEETINILANYTNLGSYAITLVKIDSHSGKLQDSNGVNHWVTITGFSKFDFTPSKSNDFYSPMNWVRIYNPFDNETEYYPWKHFRKSWKSAGNVTLIAKPKQHVPFNNDCP